MALATWHKVGRTDTLWEGNAGRSGSVGGECDGGLGWVEVVNSVGYLVGFLRPESPGSGRVTVFPLDLLPSGMAMAS